MGALDHAVRSGRAVYVGVSNYPPDLTRQAAALLRELGTPCEEGIGCITFSPLAQGLLSDRDLAGDVPADSRASRGVFLNPQDITAERLGVLRALNGMARERANKRPMPSPTL